MPRMWCTVAFFFLLLALSTRAKVTCMVTKCDSAGDGAGWWWWPVEAPLWRQEARRAQHPSELGACEGSGRQPKHTTHPPQRCPDGCCSGWCSLCASGVEDSPRVAHRETCCRGCVSVVSSLVLHFCVKLNISEFSNPSTTSCGGNIISFPSVAKPFLEKSQRGIMIHNETLALSPLSLSQSL
jgi:hypothetical protein